MVILVKPAKPAAMAEKEMGVALFHGKEIQVQIYRTYFTDVSTDFKHKIQVRGPQARVKPLREKFFSSYCSS